MKVSETFRIALKNAGKPQYEVAWAAGVEPTTLSALVIGAKRPKPRDERILAVARVLGVPENACFEGEGTEQEVPIK